VNRSSLGGVAKHVIDIRYQDKIVYVFGAESHGMYVEAFDAGSGECIYRFCTCYWFAFSERWRIE
jgi:hypothetical protein